MPHVLSLFAAAASCNAVARIVKDAHVKMLLSPHYKSGSCVITLPGLAGQLPFILSPKWTNNRSQVVEMMVEVPLCWLTHIHNLDDANEYMLGWIAQAHGNWERKYFQ